MATVADSPARSSGQRSSCSIGIRTGTRWTTLVNSPETTFRGIRANWAPVDLLIQTTRPWNGSAKASSSMRTGLPGATPGRRSPPGWPHVEQVGVVHAQERRARRGEVAQVAVALDDHAGERGADLGVRQVVLGGLQRPPGLLDRSAP